MEAQSTAYIASGAGVAVVNDTIFVCGGYDGSMHLKSVECLNVRTGQWTSMTCMNIPRCYVGACVLKGKLFVVAGSVFCPLSTPYQQSNECVLSCYRYDGSTLLNSVESYDWCLDSTLLSSVLPSYL